MTNEWQATLPGQPPSVNHTYIIARKQAKNRHGQPVLNDEGVPKTYTSLVKKASVQKYQADIQLILQAARPSGFDPKGTVYLIYDFYLARDIDTDNTHKAIQDALARVLGINDRAFMTVDRHKEIGVRDPYVRLTILDATHWQVAVTQR